jgi:hypothetical protein|tara:strand:- start:5864 stop:5977 length:114 start_codon:yes stop_codon:yes gene_type:complete
VDKTLTKVQPFLLRRLLSSARAAAVFPQALSEIAATP